MSAYTYKPELAAEIRLGYAVSNDTRRDHAGGNFDRWLAEHDRQIAHTAFADGVEAAFNYDWAAGDGQPENPHTKGKK